MPETGLVKVILPFEKTVEVFRHCRGTIADSEHEAQYLFKARIEINHEFHNFAVQLTEDRYKLLRNRSELECSYDPILGNLFPVFPSS